MEDTQEKRVRQREGTVGFILNILSYIIAWVSEAYNAIVGIKPNLDSKIGKMVDPRTAFVADVEDFVASTPPSVKDFFKDKPHYLKELAQKAADLADDTTTPICQPDLLPKTISVSLHQQVLYCDDSGSMKRDGRWDAQRNLVNRIARITTCILPPGEGVALRFINQDVDDSSSLNFEQIGEIIDSTKWGGDTPIGTSLRSKILQPMVYDKIQRNETISRPILVSVITDGMPEPEPRKTLVNSIVECGDLLEAAGYPRASVKFVIGRVGPAKSAAMFLSEVSAEQKTADVLHVVDDQMDKKMENMNDSMELDRWLIETLFASIRGKWNSDPRSLKLPPVIQKTRSHINDASSSRGAYIEHLQHGRKDNSSLEQVTISNSSREMSTIVGINQHSPSLTMRIRWALARFLITAGFLESPLNPGSSRLRWRCNCGENFCTDIMEYRAHSIDRIIQRIEQTCGARVTMSSHSTGCSGQRWKFTIPQWTSNLWAGLISKFRENQRLPRQNPHIPVSVPRRSPTTRKSTANPNSIYLLACVHRTQDHILLLQEPIDHVTNDLSLFELMKEQIKHHRGRFRRLLSFRSVLGVQFVKVHLHSIDSVETREHNKYCTPVQLSTVITQSNSSSSRTMVCNCLPPEPKREPAPNAEYRCNIDELDLGAGPPVSPKYMLHLLRSTHCINPDSKSIFNLLPRRICGELKGGSSKPAVGWGIYYEEGLDCDMVFTAIFVTFLLSSVVFGILWSVLKMDIQGAFGISSYLMTTSAIITAWVATKAKH